MYSSLGSKYDVRKDVLLDINIGKCISNR